MTEKQRREILRQAYDELGISPREDIELTSRDHPAHQLTEQLGDLILSVAPCPLAALDVAINITAAIIACFDLDAEDAVARIRDAATISAKAREIAQRPAEAEAAFAAQAILDELLGGRG